MKARPRPILKTLSSAQGLPSPSTALPFKYLHSPHVHFPPTPTLTSTFPTHSPFVYDRAPIAVSPNACALPERGGRVYNEDGATRRRVSTPIGSYFHPRAFEMIERQSVRQTPVDSPSPISNFPSPSLSSPSMHSAHSYTGAGSPIISFDTSHAFHDSYPGTPPLDHTSDELYDSNDFALMPFSVAQLKAKRKQQKISRRQSTLHLASDSFESSSKEMALDGCLGGF